MYMWIHTIVAVWGWPLITTGGVRDVLPIYMIGIPLNVGVSIVGCYWLGVAGPAIGSAVSVALVWLPWLPMLLRRRFRTPLRPLASAVVGPVLLGMPLAAGLFLLSIAYPLEELDVPAWERWLLLAATCGATTLGYLAVAWRLVLPRDDRAELRARLLGR